MKSKKRPTDPKVQNKGNPSNTFGTFDQSTHPSVSGTDQNDQFPIEFGRYRLLKELGSGGMGAVFLAHDTELDRKVALKLPHFNETKSKQLSDRFRREARLAATLDHPNICRIFDIGEHDGRQFLTMAYVEGRSLHEIIKSQGAIEHRAAVKLMQGIATTVHFAHQQGIIHRDLKPANIMIMKDKSFVIMDFGLARRIEQNDDQLTATGALLGTPAYMSPEQLQSEETTVGAQSDIYSLGIILNEMLIGRRPFQGSVPQIYAQILSNDSVVPSSFENSLDLALCQICRKATMTNLAKRYPSADTFANDLGRYLSSEQAVAIPKIELSLLQNSVEPEARLSLSRPSQGKTRENRLPKSRAVRKKKLPLVILLLTFASLTTIVCSSFLVVIRSGKLAWLTETLFVRHSTSSNENFGGQLSYSTEKSNLGDGSLESSIESPEPFEGKTRDGKPDGFIKNKAASILPTNPLVATTSQANESEVTKNTNKSTSKNDLGAIPKSSTNEPQPNSPRRVNELPNAWNMTMANARTAAFGADFKTFQTQLEWARGRAETEVDLAKFSRLEQAGTLYLSVIKKLRETPIHPNLGFDLGRTGNSARSDLGNGLLTKISADSVEIRFRGKKTTYKWNELDPKHAMTMANVSATESDPMTVASWAIFYRVSKHGNLKDNQRIASDLFKNAMGKGQVLPDLEMVFADTYEAVPTSSLKGNNPPGDLKAPSSNLLNPKVASGASPSKTNQVAPTGISTEGATRLETVIPMQRRKLIARDEFEILRPFQKLNVPYYENGAMTIRVDSGTYGWNFASIGENQLLFARVRVKISETASAAIFLTPSSGHGGAVWVDGKGLVTIGASIFANEKDKSTMPNSQFNLKGHAVPVNEWNVIACLRQTGLVTVFLNDVKVHNFELDTSPLERAGIALGIESRTIGAAVELDSYEIYEVR